MAAWWTCAQNYILPMPSAGQVHQTTVLLETCFFSFPSDSILKTSDRLTCEGRRGRIRENTSSSLLCSQGVTTFSSIRADLSHEYPFTWKLVQMQTYDSPLPEPEEVLFPSSCNWVSRGRVRNYKDRQTKAHLIPTPEASARASLVSPHRLACPSYSFPPLSAKPGLLTPAK